MLGLRGCRLGIIKPAVNVMQMSAIMLAAIQVQNEGPRRRSGESWFRSSAR